MSSGIYFLYYNGHINNIESEDYDKMDKVRVYASDNIILFQINNSEDFLIYKCVQTVKLSKMNAYEEITNEAVKKELIKNHNDVITEAILNISKEDLNKHERYLHISNNNEDVRTESLLYNALIDIDGDKR